MNLKLSFNEHYPTDIERKTLSGRERADIILEFTRGNGSLTHTRQK